MRTDNLNASELKDLARRITALERATPLNNASIGRNGLRVHSGGVITIQNGGLSITGTAEVLGQFMGSGTLTWSGPVNFTGTSTLTGQTNLDGPTTIDGATEINGNTSITGITTVTGAMNILGDVDITKTLDITGNTRIMGTTTLSDDLTLTGGGRIKVGTVTIDPGAGGSGGMTSSGYIRMSSPILWASSNIYAEGRVTAVDGFTAYGITRINSDLIVTGDSTVSGAKNFRMEHPLKAGYWLQHGSTESPISGTEYTGSSTFDDAGECVVTLPDYFEALNKPDNRSIQITPIGRPFGVGAGEIEDGKFTVYGEAGRRFYWLAKGERFGGDFPVELVREVEEPAPVHDSNSGQ